LPSEGGIDSSERERRGRGGINNNNNNTDLASCSDPTIATINLLLHTYLSESTTLDRLPDRLECSSVRPDKN
jgi:hypothetical protein